MPAHRLGQYIIFRKKLHINLFGMQKNIFAKIVLRRFLHCKLTVTKLAYILRCMRIVQKSDIQMKRTAFKAAVCGKMHIFLFAVSAKFVKCGFKILYYYITLLIDTLTEHHILPASPVAKVKPDAFVILNKSY